MASIEAPHPESAAAFDRSTKTATLTCKPGWRGSAVGQYGGVGFSVSRNNGKGTERISGTVAA